MPFPEDGANFYTDGTNGDLTCNDITCAALTATSYSGDVNFDQLKVSNSQTVNKDGTFRNITGAPNTGTVVFMVSCLTDDDACGLWVASKASTANAGTVSKLTGQNGVTSSTGLSGQWLTGAAPPSVAYSSSWGGGTGTSAAYCTILFTAA